MTDNQSHTGGDIKLEYRADDGMESVVRAARQLMAAHQRGDFRKLEIWVQDGVFKVTGRQPWDWRGEK